MDIFKSNTIIYFSQNCIVYHNGPDKSLQHQMMSSEEAVYIIPYYVGEQEVRGNLSMVEHLFK